tara:strand:+ start:389 stop:601 length:213 start_codon:yes stop_codon:yes gene_type:complete
MFINKKSLARLLNVSPSTIYRWSKNGQIPKPVSLGPNTTVWFKDEIEKWLNELKKKHRGYGKPVIKVSDE